MHCNMSKELSILCKFLHVDVQYTCGRNIRSGLGKPNQKGIEVNVAHKSRIYRHSQYAYWLHFNYFALIGKL